MIVRRFLALAILLSSLAACGLLIGVEELGVDPSDASIAPVVDGGGPSDVIADTRPPIVDADAPDTTAPDGAPTFKRVFLTSMTFEKVGMFGGAAAADVACRAAATGKGLGGDWVAWLSETGRNAKDLIPDTAYRLLDSTPIVNGKNQLVTTGPMHAINVIEDGTVVSDPEPWVWTGTSKTGVASDKNCKDWTNKDPMTFGIAGSFDKTGPWTDNGGPGLGFPGYGCQTVGRFYCFEK